MGGLRNLHSSSQFFHNQLDLTNYVRYYRYLMRSSDCFSATELQEARQNHESIAVGSTVVHIGGSGLRHTERWDIDPNGDVKITLSGAPPFNSWESKPYTFPPNS